MRVTVEYPLPDGWQAGPETTIRTPSEGARVVDPATGEAGTVASARLNWRAGRAFLVLDLDIDDESAAAALLRADATKGVSF